MLDERALQAAAAALEKNWLKLATDKEIDLLLATDSRPELFEKPQDGEIRIVLHPALAACYSDEIRDGNSVVIRTGPPDPKAMEAAADLIVRRLRLRAHLGLPSADCGARKPNPDCTCLTATLDALGDEVPEDKKAILEAARKLHVSPPRPRWGRPKATAKPSPPKRAAEALTPLPSPDPLTETSTRPDLKPRPRVWQPKPRPHPLSFRAWKDAQEGRSSWLDRTF
jgi:hypothetical protein